MGTTRKTITVTEQQDKWIKAQIDGGDFTNDSEYIRDLIRRDQARQSEVEVIRGELIRGEESGQPQAFDGELFKEQTAAKHTPKVHRVSINAGNQARPRSHLALYAQRVGPGQANRYTDELTDVFAQLAVGPQLGITCDHIRTGYRRRRAGRHIVYYRMTKLRNYCGPHIARSDVTNPELAGGVAIYTAINRAIA